MSPELPDPGFLRDARLAGATDLTVTLGRPVRARVGHSLLTLGPVSPEEFSRFRDLLRRPLQPLEVGTFSCEGDRLRYVYYLSESGPTFELRHLPSGIPALASLGLPPAFLPLIRRRSGLIIVTGATGSGKSTTLASVIEELNQAESGLKIVTLEDPIEYLHPERGAVVRQCEYRRDFPDFPAAIRALLRQNPDVALVGELRDPESIAAALSIAETGHLVLATLHTRDAAGSVSRILDAIPGPDIPGQLADSLAGVLAQQLVPGCAQPRVPVFELLLSTTAVRACIREKRADHLRDEIRRGHNQGMTTMDDSLAALCRSRVITRETALDCAHNREELRRKLEPHRP
jgi:twitching motility protein PilT